MGQLYQCDRCKMLTKSCETLRSRDLCASCIDDFEGWVVAGPLRFTNVENERGHKARNKPGATLQFAAALADRDGLVTARAFAEAAQEDYRVSYQRLRYLASKGLIQRVKGSVYRVRATGTQEAAE